MKATEQYFVIVLFSIMLQKVVLSFGCAISVGRWAVNFQQIWGILMACHGSLQFFFPFN